MKDIITCYQDALDIRCEFAIRQRSGKHFLYRGHASTNYELIATVARKKPINEDLFNSELACFSLFKELAIKENWLKYKIAKCDEDLFYMSIARHLGLYCRLLDWSASLETSLFFASKDEKYKDEDGFLYILEYEKKCVNNAMLSPFLVNDVTIIKLDFITQTENLISDQPEGIVRRFEQNGLFTISPTDQIGTPLDRLKLNNIFINKFKITKEAKQDILKNLNDYNDYLHMSSNSRIENKIKEINEKYFR